MFDWFKGLFSGGSPQVGQIDPEAGVPISEYSGLGRSQGPNEGTGEGFGDFSLQSYERLGRMLQQAAAGQAEANLIESGINAGFDQNWLASSSTLGSAMGQKIG